MLSFLYFHNMSSKKGVRVFHLVISFFTLRDRGGERGKDIGRDGGRDRGRERGKNTGKDTGRDGGGIERGIKRGIEGEIGREGEGGIERERERAALEFEYLHEFETKFRTKNVQYGSTSMWSQFIQKQETKISCYCPFK
jgi:hypothetical protein